MGPHSHRRLISSRRPTKGGKGKGKLNGQVLATKTPDGREICFGL